MNITIEENHITVDKPRMYVPYDKIKFHNKKCMCGKHDIPTLTVYLDGEQTLAILPDSVDKYNKLKSEYEKIGGEPT